MHVYTCIYEYYRKTYCFPLIISRKWQVQIKNAVVCEPYSSEKQ